MTSLSAVLFDWRGTLVTVLEPLNWAREALRLAGRTADDDASAALWEAIKTAAGHPDRLASPECDTSTVVHRRASYNEFALDAGPTLRRLASAGIKIGVVSDIHFDLRPVFAAQELDTSIDAFVLSYEHGVQKPDPAIFQIALEELGSTPRETLMVGDRASHDGAAVSLGMATLLLPPLTNIRETRLHLVDGIVAATA